MPWPGKRYPLNPNLQSRENFAGAGDPVWGDYAEGMQENQHELSYYHPLDGYDHTIYMGTIGVALFRAQAIRPIDLWAPTYGGDLPASQQPIISAPDPWDVGGVY